MRPVLAISFLLLLPLLAQAQQQEEKLVDRVMKPNMSLRNDAQNKHFNAGGASVSKKAYVAAFYAPNKSVAKRFSGEREFNAKQYSARRFESGDTAANLSTRSILKNAQSNYATRTTPTFRAGDSTKSSAISEFAGSRTFLGRGKSQKALSAQDKPMTIDEVRELLNKNK